ncbi:MAG: hypothetical protein GAK30_00616 [Paracidovorax wautersii]|uniref:Uncharacterized protein n=1 Tax=Paracidovorax wautersii TaxID=1177982 RepID=A0A7V8JRD1_9BURK|nr:MAG: hypothetical protein GAK30_00616 [Paracidovorax wautersii]
MSCRLWIISWHHPRGDRGTLQLSLPFEPSQIEAAQALAEALGLPAADEPRPGAAALNALRERGYEWEIHTA